MNKFNLFFLLLLFCCSCQPQSLAECRHRGIIIQMNMLDQLKEVHTLADLQNKRAKLEKLHIELIEVVQRAHFLQKRGYQSANIESVNVSIELRDEILRVCSIPGALAVFEGIQQEALYLLDHIR